MKGENENVRIRKYSKTGALEILPLIFQAPAVPSIPSIINVFAKLFSMIINEKVNHLAEDCKVWREEQSRFTKGGGGVENIITLKVPRKTQRKTEKIALHLPRYYKSVHCSGQWKASKSPGTYWP